MDGPAVVISSENSALRRELVHVLERYGSAVDPFEETEVRNGAVSVLLRVAAAMGDQVLKSLQAAIESHLRQHTAPAGAQRPSGLLGGERLIGDSVSMRQLRESIERISASDSNVLITGETGTGKELVAELVQSNGPRRTKPFVCINCAAIPDDLLESELFGYERGAFTGAHTARAGKLEQADRGTLFFDEIGDMSPCAQAKILRAIETREVQRLGGKRSARVDVRIIAATNSELDSPEGRQTFRRDLYFRLNVAGIHLAPLRERTPDIPLLVRYYIGELNRRFSRNVAGLAPDILPHLLRYNWPGNVRELKNILESTFVSLASGPVEWMQLPEPLRRRIMGMGALAPSEQERLLNALWSTGWNKTEAARQLQWSRMTVYRKMAKYDLAKNGLPRAQAGAS